MDIKIGTVVVSKAGRDKGEYLAVTDVAGDRVYVCNGKDRPVERPKAKNPNHVAVTDIVLPRSETTMNRSLNKALNLIQQQSKK